MAVGWLNTLVKTYLKIVILYKILYYRCFSIILEIWQNQIVATNLFYEFPNDRALKPGNPNIISMHFMNYFERCQKHFINSETIRYNFRINQHIIAVNQITA